MVRKIWLTAGKPVTDHSAGRILGRAFSDVRHKEGKNYGSSRKGNTGHKIREEKPDKGVKKELFETAPL